MLWHVDVMEKLNAWQEAHGVTDAELARRIDITASRLCRIKKGERPLPPNIAWRIVAVSREKIKFEELYLRHKKTWS